MGRVNVKRCDAWSKFAGSIDLRASHIDSAAMSLEGKTIVVSGGTGALGRAVVGRLLDRGAQVHIPNNAPGELEDFPYRDHDRVAIAEGIDLTDEDSVEAYYASHSGLWGSVHLAGGFGMAKLPHTGMDDYRRLVDLNLTTCFLCCRAAVIAMRRAGHGGRIVNVAARPALEPRQGAGMTVYTATKAAVAAFTQAVAEEVAPEGIWVNAIAPSIIDTPANREAMPKADHANWPTPEQIAATIGFLVSPENAVTRGAVVPVYGRA